MVFDAIIIGAGASGLMCAIQAGRRGRRVLVIDHAKQAGSKIRISGGGHCNFTNRNISAAQYVSINPHFCKSALSGFSPDDFIQMLQAHSIDFEERTLGQLFCIGSAHDIVTMLVAECKQNEVKIELDCKVSDVSVAETSRFAITTNKGTFASNSLVIATGGLSIPKAGATDFGYKIARQFSLNVIETTPALDGFTLDTPETKPLCALAGIAIECIVSCNKASFRENILFTHTGLSGPASLQASLHWHKGDSIFINLFPDIDLFQLLLKEKKLGNRAIVKNIISKLIPSRLAEHLCNLYFPSQLPLPQVSEAALKNFCTLLHALKITPSGSVGYGKAEVTRGGVDTNELSSKTMEAKKVPGLYFIGEVVDVTGWLGGYNLHWAWASGYAAGNAI